MAKQLSASETILSHLPKKNFKYKVIIKDDDFRNELIESNFDNELLDTIKNDQLVFTGYNNTDFNSYDRSTVSRAKQPTVIDKGKGIVVSKQLITKTDKKLLTVDIKSFNFEDTPYVMIKFVYEKFDIVEIFLLVN